MGGDRQAFSWPLLDSLLRGRKCMCHEWPEGVDGPGDHVEATATVPEYIRLRL